MNTKKILPIFSFTFVIMHSSCFLGGSTKEYKHALVVLDIGLLQEKESMLNNNESMLSDFASEVIVDPKNETTKQKYDKAIQVAKLSKEMIDFVERMKVEVVMATDGVDENTAKDRVMNPFMVERKGDYDRTTNYFGTSNPPGNTGKAGELKARLIQFKTKLMSFVESRDVSRMEKSLAVFDLPVPEPSENNTWEMSNFYHLPLSAALAQLSRWQVAICNAEYVMLNYLMNGPSTSSTQLDNIVARIVAESDEVMAGSSFEADVFLSVYSPIEQYTVTYGSSVDEETGFVVGGIDIDESQFIDGKAHISVPASGQGERSLEGKITAKNRNTGSERFYVFRTRYQVRPKNK